MTFNEAIRSTFLQKYVTFSGRALRSEYWYVMLFYYGLLAVLGVIYGVVGAMGAADPAAIPGMTWGMVLVAFVGAVFVLGTLLPLLAVSVRRFHDINLTAWWLLALVVVGFVPPIGWLASVTTLVVSIWRGTSGTNNFGADPLTETNPATFE